jgi:uncharacterized protein YcbK (DUF882 family)
MEPLRIVVEGRTYVFGVFMNQRKIDRRKFLKLGALATVAAISPVPVFGAFDRFSSLVRKLSFYNTHTEETLDVAYCVRERYRPDALQGINHILRDHRTGEVAPIDPALLDLLHTLSRKIGTTSPFHIISGYRSPVTNDMLRDRSRNVARNSLHMEGKAVDIRLPDCDLGSLRQAALDLKKGGVGFYPGPNFVHVDVGRVRFW